MDVDRRCPRLKFTEEIRLILSVMAVFLDLSRPHIGRIKVSVAIAPFEDFIIFGEQADFFAHLAEKPFLHGFPIIDAALRELPCSGYGRAFADEQIAIVIDHKCGNVGSIFYHWIKRVSESDWINN